MEYGACNVVYANRRAHDEHVKKETLDDSLIARASTGPVPQGYFSKGKAPPPDISSTVERILSTFDEGKIPLCHCFNSIRPFV
jgi:3',5'-cyclic-nucleotide phosphodiesterase